MYNEHENTLYIREPCTLYMYLRESYTIPYCTTPWCTLYMYLEDVAYVFPYKAVTFTAWYASKLNMYVRTPDVHKHCRWGFPMLILPKFWTCHEFSRWKQVKLEKSNYPKPIIQKPNHYLKRPSVVVHVAAKSIHSKLMLESLMAYDAEVLWQRVPLPRRGEKRATVSRLSMI